jgi:tetratricopeptide (TPR) repeat protein
LAKVQGLIAEKEYDVALGQLEDMLVRWPGNPRLHILWATLVQLQESPTHTLDEAKHALQSAALLDENSPAAGIELGHFLDAVEDNPQAAAKVFSEAVRTGRRLLIDALLGQARILLELNRREEAIACLMESLYLTSANSPSNRGKPSGSVLGILSQESTGPAFRLPLTGVFGSEIEGLLGDVLAGQGGR